MDTDPDDPQYVGADGHYYGLRVRQASGVVAVQAGCPTAKALGLLVDYAAQHECTIDETATEVIERRLRFDVEAPR